MNAAAFDRGEAISRLEQYAGVIVEHLALVTWYPEHQARNHWDVELRAFCKVLRRYHTSKRNRGNFTKSLIIDALDGIIETEEARDYVLIGVEAHDVSLPDDPDWEALRAAFDRFATAILEA